MHRGFATLTVALLIAACGATPAGTGGDSTAASTGQGTRTSDPTAAPANPAPNTAFSGLLETVPGVSGKISFVISDAGQIAEMKLEGGLTRFDCGGGKTIVDSGTSTFFFPEPIAIEAGRFSISRSGSFALDWDGVFDSATSVRGNIRVSGGTDCQNRPPSVTWSAAADGS